MKRTGLQARMLFSDNAGVIRDHPRLLALGEGGGPRRPLVKGTVIEMPRGSDLFMLPGRSPRGWDARAEREVVFPADDQGHPVHAVAAFLAPAHTATLLAAYRPRPGAPDLPLFSYAAVGFARGRYWAAARRVDRETRQDPWRFDPQAIARAVAEEVAATPSNRLLQQLRRCALEYQCRAAQNFFLQRHEAPLPTSVACNARCLGCISLQPDGSFKAAHDRLNIAPSPEEVAGVATVHIRRVARAVVSFGQGCEGEPLLMGDLLARAVSLIRETTDAGTINLNTNASLPEVVAELADRGLDSMRVSLSSAQPDLYNRFYRPQDYGWQDVLDSMRRMSARGRFVSLNLLYFPGVTDRPAELDALANLVGEAGVGMIQLRNLNIDPEIYRAALPRDASGPGLGLGAFMRRLRERCPGIRYGYFNPPKERYAAWGAD